MIELNYLINSEDIVENLVTQIPPNQDLVAQIPSNELQNLSTEDSLTVQCEVEVKSTTKRKRNTPYRSNEFYEVTIPSMTMDDFRQHFKMSRSCFESILTRIGNRIRIFNMEKKLLLTIWVLTTRESYLAVGERFAVSSGPSHQYFRDILDGLIVLFKEYVSWPSANELPQIEQGFKPANGCYVPGIGGAINSCHLLIKKPSRYSIYCNPKRSHSVILQAVCDHQKIFTDVYVGAPGCLAPERVYNNSPLSKVISQLLPEDFHIVGNTYLPLKQNLVVPYLHNEEFTETQRLFNEYLAAANSTVQQAFQLLLARFHRLTFLDTVNPEHANRMIVSCIILHNHILMTDVDEDTKEILKECPELYLNEDPKGNAARDDDPDGIAKRNYLLSLFGYI